MGRFKDDTGTVDWKGNKVQEVCPEFISRISKLGDKWVGREVIS